MIMTYTTIIGVGRARWDRQCLPDYMSGLSLSVIVPVYNEEEYIRPCLESLLRQCADIHEIIVVDNNSTDSTMEIVASYAENYPLIRMVSEVQPGVVYARNRGFDEATGHILGRIDADTRVTSTWARDVLNYFGRGDTEKVGGVTGLNDSYDSPYRKLKRWSVDWQVSRGMLGCERRLANMHGANMAIRYDAWKTVRDQVCIDPGVHEDFDLGICIAKAGYEIAQLDQMRVEVSPRRAYTSPIRFVTYVKATLETGRVHGIEGFRIRFAALTHWFGHVAVWLAYRPYDPTRKRFSIKRAILGGSGRALPVR